MIKVLKCKEIQDKMQDLVKIMLYLINLIIRDLIWVAKKEVSLPEDNRIWVMTHQCKIEAHLISIII